MATMSARILALIAARVIPRRFFFFAMIKLS
jgi:hypothetical protein